MDALRLAPRRSVSWQVLLILLAAVLAAGLLKAPMIIANEYAEQPGQWAEITLAVVWSGLLLYGIPAVIGYLLAAKVGMGLPFVEGWKNRTSIKGNFGKVILVAFLAAAILTAVGIGVRLMTAPLILADLQARNIPLSALGGAVQAPWWAWLMGSLSAGIAEEVGFRLGVLTLLVWVLGWIWHEDSGRSKPVAFWLANIIVAVLFGAFHLLNISALGLPFLGSLVARAIFGNALVALALGWLYWRFGLECAITTHFFVDVFLYVLLPMLV